MMTRLAVPVVLALLAVLCGPAANARAEDYAKRVEEKAASVVTVKYVLKVSFGGPERESEATDLGIVVDPSGIVVLPMWGGRFMRASNAKATPVNLRVLFDDDEKEYDAVVGATDSKLGIAFVAIKDLEGKKISSVDFADAAEPKIGDELFGVTRLDQGFDYAPYFGLGRIAGQVTKPRPMWIVQGFMAVTHPLYTLDGKTAGLVIRQSGVNDEGSFGFERAFLLPAKAAGITIAQAVKASKEALVKSKEKEAEGAMDDAAMGEPAMDGAPMEGGGMDTAPDGMGDAK